MLLGTLGALLGALGLPLAALGRSWALLGALGVLLGTLGVLCGGLWAPLGRSWAPLGALGVLFGTLGVLFGALVGTLGFPLAAVGRSWVPLGCFWEHSGRSLVPFWLPWPLLGALGCNCPWPPVSPPNKRVNLPTPGFGPPVSSGGVILVYLLGTVALKVKPRFGTTFPYF